jgi:hypothetical protein
MDRIKQWISDVLKETGNNTVCIARVMAIIAFVSFLGYAVFGLVHEHFALNDFGNGLMTVLLGSGGVLAGKNLTQK